MSRTSYQRRVMNIYPDAYIAKGEKKNKAIDYFYVTTPELHKQGKILGEYKTFKCKAWESADAAMQTHFTQLTTFNVAEALQGKPIITRSGIAVTGFRKRTDYMALPYECEINGKTHYYSESGKFVGDDIHRFDLFMK
jgi:hypothetical protein